MRLTSRPAQPGRQTGPGKVHRPAALIQQQLYALDGCGDARDAGVRPRRRRNDRRSCSCTGTSRRGRRRTVRNSLPKRSSSRASGVISLLVDTPWTKENWFPTRDAAKDFEFTQQMTKDVRRAIDVLRLSRGSTRSRVALVGHDFGAMWGALAVADDPRVTHFVYMAGTGSFTDWYLFTPRRKGPSATPSSPTGAARSIAYLAKISPRPVLLQFGTKDPFVKNEAATAMGDAVTGPKTVKTYEFEHELTFQARRDRIDWLKVQFKLQVIGPIG